MADVQILMPVWQGAGLLPETLRSVRDQRDVDFEVLVSVEPGDPASLAVLREVAAADARFRVFAQEQRLGWPGHLGWLLAQATAPFVIYWQQDDLASSGYVRALLDALERRPDASVAAVDVQFFGDRFDRQELWPVEGTPLARILEVVEQLSFVPLRGLIRRAMLPEEPVTARPEDRELGAGTEFVFLAQLAARGPFVRTQDALYFKRAHPASTTSKVDALPPHRARRAWAAMGAGLLDVALAHAPTGTDGRLLELLLDRLCVERPFRGFAFRPELSVRGVADMAWALADAAGLDLGELRWERGPVTGLERPVHPSVRAGLATARAQARALRELEAGRREGAAIAPLLGFGWHPVEGWGAWSDGAHASVELGPHWPGGTVGLEAHAFAVDGPAPVGWSLSGAPGELVASAPDDPVRFEIDVPRRTPRVHLHAPDAPPPADRDPRRLGLGLSVVELRPAGA